METIFWKKDTERDTGCLNRTMQYGNQKIITEITANPNMFKSYYVVWKLSGESCYVLSPESLNRTMQYGNCSVPLSLNNSTKLFKSYYVVWKRENEETTKYLNIGGLNRTMQYGNF